MTVKVDLGSWTTMKPILRWQQAATSGDILAMTQIMQEVVKEWPYEGDPGKLESYENLAPAEWSKVLQEVGQAVGGLFRAA